ncbi:MAG: patatin-like phospholipase family protein [Burkholderiales bacterium]
MYLPHQDQLLARHLRTYLGDVEPAAIEELRACLDWIAVPAGTALMNEGETGDAMYLVLSGRLRAYVKDDEGHPRAVREMGRGQIVGEMSVITGEPRRATVVTVRDSVLVRLRKSDFDRLLATSPRLSVVMTRQIIEHLRSREETFRAARPVTIALVPVSAGVDTGAFARSLAEHMGRAGRVSVLDAAALDGALGDGMARRPADDAEASMRIAMRMNEVEAENDCVLLVADDAPTPWTVRCCRGADEILLLARASEPPALHANETDYLMRREGRAESSEILVLLHPRDARSPRGTREWLARRPVTDHVHVRPDLPADMARLARIESHAAVGLVLAGGGARGLAHLGVYRALRERGIEVDYVGGTSIGAIMAAMVASDCEPEALIAVARKWFSTNPTGDYNFLPLLSLIKGRRLRRAIDGGIRELWGFDPEAQDLWKNFYCVASNYSQAGERALRQGNLGKALRASSAIPGALPPVVHDGDLLCDGGTFNNFPVDLMQRMRGIGTVIGVDLSTHKARRYESDDVPHTWALLRDRMRPYKQRRYRFPSLLSYLMNVQILYSISRQEGKRKLTDVYFNPPLERVGMLQWDRFDDIVQQGHAHAVETIDGLPPHALARLRRASA